MASQEKLRFLSEEEIEELYYKAVQDAKLGEAMEEQGQEAAGALGYSLEEFSRWARTIDIYTLGEGAADFSKEEHEQIVKDFGEYRHKVAAALSEELKYENVPLNGQLKDIGSCIDGSKVGSVNEMDSLYILQGNNFTIRQSDKQGLYRVFVGKDSTDCEVEPRRIREQLAHTYSELLSRVMLPDSLEHGGYKQACLQSKPPRSNVQDEGVHFQESGYSGVRYNGPAVTSQFLTTDGTLLTWDITPVVVLSDVAELQAGVRESQPMQAIIADNPDRMFPPTDVHLFPDSTVNLWRVTTAQMEADVLGRLPRSAPFKEAFSACKVLAKRLKDWHKAYQRKARLAHADVDIIKEVITCSGMQDSKAKAKAMHILDRKMRFAHVWIPIDVGDEYNEDTKCNISINNAAVKYILLKAASRIKGAFSVERNSDVVKRLMLIAFEVLANNKCYSSEHSFLAGVRISHFSVAPGMASHKLSLARDISQQCRTLLHESMGDTLPRPTLQQTVAELNECAMDSADLRCPEYGFVLDFNPCQHPILNKNIHHLLALVSFLCDACGGLICLTCEDTETNITKDTTETFQARLTEILAGETELVARKKVNFTQVPLQLGKQRPWIVIHLKSYGQTLKRAEFHINLHGWIEFEQKSDEMEEIKPDPCIDTLNRETPQSDETDGNGLEGQASAVKTESKITATLCSSEDSSSSDDCTNIQVDFSSLDALDWSTNKKDWESYVYGEAPTIEKIVDSSHLWQPTRPMTVTPDKECMGRWFRSREDMEELLSVLDTKEPGFAIACKTWMFHLLADERESRPAGHICDILTVSSTGRVRLWVICGDDDGQNVGCQLEYLMLTGRMIKYQLVSKRVGDLSNLCIECRLFFPSTSARKCDIVRSPMEESLEMQSHILGFCEDGVIFESLQKALAMVILSKESPLKRPVGSETAITLSSQQAEVLFNRGRVNYVCGPAGSGKSFTAAFLCNLYGKDNSVYICTTMEFVEYLKPSGYRGTLVQRDEDLVREIQDGTFKNKNCVVIDDSHNFACSKSSVKELFKLLKENKEMSLFVFADNDYQSFDKKRQQAMRNCIRELSLQVLGKEPHYAYLTAIYRNTKKVVSFVQSAIQDSYEDYQQIECRNMESGDGVECIRMSNIWANSGRNDLAVYIRNVQLSEAYKVAEIAVLFDPSYTADQIEECRRIMREHIPDSQVQTASVFPRKGVVIDSVNSFLGLDAPLCVFVLSRIGRKKTSFLQRLFKKEDTEPDTSLHNPHFRVFMASRATHRAVFVVPEIDMEIVNELKFDHLEAPVNFRKLSQTHEIQWNLKLEGVCCAGNRLYCVEAGTKYLLPDFDIRCLTVYALIEREGGHRVLDTVELCSVELGSWWAGSPCVDRQSHHEIVYVPCGTRGVKVFHCEGYRLEAGSILRCVRDARDAAVCSGYSVYVVDRDSASVCLINVSTDTVTRRLQTPADVRGMTPRHVSVLGETVLVCYGNKTLVTHRRGNSSQVMHTYMHDTWHLDWVCSIATDSHSSFLVTDRYGSVFVLDEMGSPRHMIHALRQGLKLQDCTVVQSQLWLRYCDGSLSVMASH